MDASPHAQCAIMNFSDFEFETSNSKFEKIPRKEVTPTISKIPI